MWFESKRNGNGFMEKDMIMFMILEDTARRGV